MRITFLLGSAFMLEIMGILFMLMNLRSITIQTLPWIALVLSAFIISIPLTIYGKQIILLLAGLLHVKIPFTPEGYVDGRYFIIKGADTKQPIAGFSVVKIIPITPTVDMDKEEKLRIVESIEALVYSMSAPLQYSMFLMPSKEVQKEIKKIQTQLARLHSLKSKQHGVEPKIQELEQELRRLTRTTIAVTGLYMKVWCYGFSEEQVKDCLERKLTAIQATASQINARAEVLSHTDLWEYREMEKKGEVYGIIPGVGASPVRS